MNIIVLLSRVPNSLEKGDKLRAFEQIKYLSKYHNIYLFCITDKKNAINDLDLIKPYVKRIELFHAGKITIGLNIVKMLFSNKPLQFGFFFFKKAENQLKQFIRNVNPDYIYCQLIRMAPYLDSIDVPKTLDYQDAFSLGMQRRMKFANIFLKPLFYYEYKKLCKAETYYLNKFHNKTIISDIDKNFILRDNNKTEVIVVKNGVDFNKFEPKAIVKDIDVLFVGNLSYPPNINAAKFLAQRVAPILLKELPSINIHIVGANANKHTLALSSSNITVKSNVPDTAAYYDRAKVFAAPMFLGSGLQNKLLEAMAMKVPCITTELANSALNATVNKEILIAATAADFAHQITFLLHNETEIRAIANAAELFVKNNYSWAIETEKLNKLISNR